LSAFILYSTYRCEMVVYICQEYVISVLSRHIIAYPSMMA